MSSGPNVSNVLTFASARRSPNADEVPSLPCRSSSAQDDDLTTQQSSTSLGGTAAGASPPVTASHAIADRTSIHAQLLHHRFATSAFDRHRSKVIGATISAEEWRRTEFSFAPELQDPILSARRYRIVKELGKGSYGKVFLAWDERRQYACVPVVTIYSLLLRSHTTTSMLTYKRYFDSLLVAVKTQHKQRNASLRMNEATQVVFFLREMAALKELHHQNLVEWFHTIETTTDIYMVLEFCGERSMMPLNRRMASLKMKPNWSSCKFIYASSLKFYLKFYLR